MINNISQLNNNVKYYKLQNRQKTTNLSFKADSVEVSDKDREKKNKKDKKKVPVWSLFLAFFIGYITPIILRNILPKPGIM